MEKVRTISVSWDIWMSLKQAKAGHILPSAVTWMKTGESFRGILDNKGPVLSCLYALYALKRLHIPLSRQVRIMFGTDEESGFEDLTYYLSKEKPPVMGWTPDCKYPVVYGSKRSCKSADSC